MAYSSSRSKLTFSLFRVPFSPGLRRVGNWIYSVTSEISAFDAGPAQHHCPTTAFIPWPGVMIHGWVGGEWKRVKELLPFSSSSGQVRIAGPGALVGSYVTRSSCTGERGHQRPCLRQEWGYSGTRAFSSTTGDICCEKHISTSYGRGWGCAPQLHRCLLVSSVPSSPKHLQDLPSRPPLHKHTWQTLGVAEGTLVSGTKSCNKFPSDVCRAVFAPQGLPGASQTLNLLQQFQEEHSRQTSCVGYSCWVVIRTTIWRIRTSQSHRMSWAGRVAQGS